MTLPLFKRVVALDLLHDLVYRGVNVHHLHGASSD